MKYSRTLRRRRHTRFTQSGSVISIAQARHQARGKNVPSNENFVSNSSNRHYRYRLENEPINVNAVSARAASAARISSPSAGGAAGSAAGPPQPPPPPPWSNSPSYIGKERGSTTTTTQHTSCRTIVNTFTSPGNLELFNLSTVFEV